MPEGHDKPIESGHCTHSFFDDDCLSCWVGYAARMKAENLRLRAILLGCDEATIAAEHDAYWRGGNVDA